MEKFTLTFGEAERQLLILAAAHLALKRPGWDDALHRLIEPIDTDKLYESFKDLRVDLSEAAIVDVKKG